ncbi:MAG: hypothetical protein ACXWNK_06660 [Vulcanimicrobiaceae bacterium]
MWVWSATGYHGFMSDQHLWGVEDPTLPVGPDAQSLVRSAISAIVRVQQNRTLGKWQFEAALFLLEDALTLGLFQEAVRLGEGLLAQDPGNERVSKNVLQARLAMGDATGASKLLYEVYA